MCKKQDFPFSLVGINHQDHTIELRDEMLSFTVTLNAKKKDIVDVIVTGSYTVLVKYTDGSDESLEILEVK
jgi:hypothetical protein